MNRVYKYTQVIVLLLLLTSISIAQTAYKPSKERGDAKSRAKGQMEGNKIRASIFNHGVSGRYDGSQPISVWTPYEWPKNTGHVYLAMTQIWVGGEVADENGQLQRIIDVANGRNSPKGKTWNFEPVPGYYKNKGGSTQEMANSADPTTWPDSWPDKADDPINPGWSGEWNGYFGRGKLVADQELYYRAADNNYDRYNYFPDSTDLSRKGLGIRLEGRALAWSQVLVEDVVYLLNYITNDGTKDINKVGVTVWYADFVGGDGDSQDDISEFNLLEDIAWSRDRDHRAPNFGSDPVGIIAVTFLETPGNAVDRVDNDGDSPEPGPKVTAEMLVGESDETITAQDPRRTNGIDDNGNGLVDENMTHIPFGGDPLHPAQAGVSYADGIDQGGVPAETGAPLVTAEMVAQAANDKWKRWPANPENDAIQAGKVHLIMLENEDVGKAFKDGIDNNGNGEPGSPVVTAEMVAAAAADAPNYRYKVPGTSIILYDVKAEDIGKAYADGKDNDGNRAVDEYMDEGIDEMVDESRDNGIDDDGDWNPLTDDTGMDGDITTSDYGNSDGRPTSGAGTEFPGEKNIDVTDVSETDQIGITNAQYFPGGKYNLSATSDGELWFDMMIPGKFYNPQLVTAGEYDLFVSSSFFPLKSGQREPISLAVILANGPVPDPNGQYRQREVLKKRVRAQETYNNDYQFANAPVPPRVTAIPGNNRVTLYWDSEAENSFDEYISNIGGNGRDFEGYRIYRASDPAFQDAEQITNGFGSTQFKTWIANFDLQDGKKGFDSIGIEGVHFYLGDDNGVQHSWTDTTVQNGFTYYYAITSYDFGYPAGQILPSESPIRVSVQLDGSVILGPNVVRVTPEAPAAGYVPATLGNINLVQGSTTGRIGYDVVDPNKIKNGHTYYITFQDTLVLGNAQQNKPDTLKTKNYTLVDSTAGVVLVNKSTRFAAGLEQPLIDGFKLNFRNEARVEVNKNTSKWNNSNVAGFAFEKFVWPGGLKGEERPNDYMVVFGDVGFGTSVAQKIGTVTFPAKQTNFQVFNRSTNQPVSYVFMEVDSTAYGTPGMLSTLGARRDRIILLEPNKQGTPVYTWWFYLLQEATPASGLRIPQAGDTAMVNLNKPFLSSDIFKFTASGATVNQEAAKANLDDIKVVPNPYMAEAKWEKKNPYNSGRGPRELHFTHLPARCTIRIYTVNGELVDVIEHNSAFDNGTAYWDMLSKDNLSISYGVYVYHVDAPGIGEKIGKFAVIK